MEKLINQIICGDCLDILLQIPENSVDAVITDPPYELGFMSKMWDKTGIAYNVTMWREVLRVLKPGGHLLSFGGSRTYHRMACAIEDAGFEIRDMVNWVYSQGFPKSESVDKAIDKKACREQLEKELGKKPTREEFKKAWEGFRKVVGKRQWNNPMNKPYTNKHYGGERIRDDIPMNITRPFTPEAKQWEGWGTALKPSHEPIVFATKNLTNSLENDLITIDRKLKEVIWLSIEKLQRTDMCRLQETVSIHLNIVLLWHAICNELLTKESKSITSTESKQIIELKILSCLLSKNTQENTVGESQIYPNGMNESQVNGYNCLARVVAKVLDEEKKNMQSILTLIVQELVSYRQSKDGISVKNVENDLLPIILNANIVLKNVLTDLIIGKDKKELNILVNIAETSLKQYLAEPQNIVTQDVWLSHINTIPNHSPIVMARKPLSEKTVALNVLKWGTGGINIDGCRVGYISDYDKKHQADIQKGEGKFFGGKGIAISSGNLQGRFPANLILECICDEVKEGKEEIVSIHDAPKGTFAGGEQGRGSIKNYRERSVGKAIIHTNPNCPCYMLDRQSGKTGAFAPVKSGQKGFGGTIYGKYKQAGDDGKTFYGDGLAGASRFFYCAKSSRTERDAGLEGMPDLRRDATTFNPTKPICNICGCGTLLTGAGKRLSCGHNDYHFEPSIGSKEGGEKHLKNNHPTVKPLALMRYLIKLITPPNGILLDMFAGSGSTLIACKQLDYRFIGIEKEQAYCDIATKRISKINGSNLMIKYG